MFLGLLGIWSQAQPYPLLALCSPNLPPTVYSRDAEESQTADMLKTEWFKGILLRNPNVHHPTGNFIPVTQSGHLLTVTVNVPWVSEHRNSLIRISIGSCCTFLLAV